MWMNIKIDLILLLISVGLVSLADAGRFRDCFTGGKNDVPQEDPLKFMEPYLENSKREFEEKFNHPQQCTGTFTNYDITAWLGEEGNNRAVLGQIKGTVNYNAIKIVHKEDTFGRGPVPEILLEKRIFQSINFPFLIKMESCFKDNSNLYFAMEYSPCGTLTTELPEHVVKFYAAQIVLALHYLHSMNLIYQDLKLENVLIGQDGYIKILDLQHGQHGLANSPGGTVAYMAPEMLIYQKYDKSVDWWSLGVLIYRMISGMRPFDVTDDDTWFLSYQTIVREKLKFDNGF